MSLSHHERRKQLETILFKSDPKLQPRVSGLLSGQKSRMNGMSLPQAVSDFWDRNPAKLSGTDMNSKPSREYVELRLREWCS